SLGKLSSNGPCTPSGYQMKCPIPREAKFSPLFQDVRPEIVPLHSFCHILWPMRRASAGESDPNVKSIAQTIATPTNTGIKERRLISGIGFQPMIFGRESRCHDRRQTFVNAQRSTLNAQRS